METVSDFIFLGSKITANGDCSHEIKRRLLLGSKFMSNLDSTLKCRDITLPTKVHLVKAMVFPVVMYGCESWTVKKSEHWRTDGFQLWYWRRLFFFFNLNLFILIRGQLLYNIVLVLPYINMNPPWVYTCSQSWSRLPPPSLYHPSGSSQCTSPSFLYPALNLDWRFIFYMILYMFQCHSPKSSLPSLSHRVQKTVLYICVSFGVSHTGLSLPSF